MQLHQPHIEGRYRIGHISDPHLSRQYYREHLKSFKILLRTMIDAGFDHIVISGDIVSTGEEEDYYLAREILSKAGILRSDRLTVVPGNHDIFGGPHRAVDVLSFPRHIRSVDYSRNLSLFQEAFRESFEGVISLGGTSIFPFIKHAGPFSIIGMNSIPRWSLFGNPLGTNGWLDQDHLNAFTEISETQLVGERIPIAVLHHHFNSLQDDSIDHSLWKRLESNTMRMKKRRKTIHALKSLGIRYVLHGHIHRNEIYSTNEVTFLNGAGAVCDDPIRFLKYNILEQDPEMISVRSVMLNIPYQASTVTLSHPFHKFRLAPAGTSIR